MGGSMEAAQQRGHGLDLIRITGRYVRRTRMVYEYGNDPQTHCIEPLIGRVFYAISVMGQKRTSDSIDQFEGQISK